MHSMCFSTDIRPSILTARQLRSALRHQALVHHPDKTGLMGKARLTNAESETLKSSSTKFHMIQSHFDTLSAFVEAREQENSLWTSALLSKLDNYYIKLLSEFDKIDEKAEKAKESAKGRSTSEGGYLGNAETES